METLGDVAHMTANGAIPLAPLLARLETSPHLTRALAAWSLREAAWLDPKAPAETVAFRLANSAFSDPGEADWRDTLTAWLLSLDIPSRLADALRTEADPAWRDRLEQAAVLWPSP
ncbi:MAG: hypothetical protein AAFU49_18630 [Pseudomonadota bacterium]